MESKPEPLSDIVLDHLLTKRRETSELDFKYTLDISKSSNFATIAKDIFAFSNSGGGHILFGFYEKETGSYELRGLPTSFHIDQADLQEKFNSYSNELIELDYKEFEREIEGNIKKFAAIYMPPSHAILKAIKSGTYKDSKGNTKSAFNRRDILIRRGTQSVIASYEEIKHIEKRVAERHKNISLISGEPDIINENIFSNLFPVIEIPNYIYRYKIIDEQIYVYNLMNFDIAYYKTGDYYYTFSDNFDDGFKNNVEDGIIERISVNDFYIEGRINIVTALLNKELFIHNRNIGLSNDIRNNHIYFYPTRKPKLQMTWKSRYRKSTRIVAQRIYINSLKQYVFWHLAAEMRFIHIENKYFINITPKIILTRDGSRSIHGFREGTVITRLSYNEFNDKYLNHILFWRSQLITNDKPHIVLNNRIKIEYDPVSVNLQFGIKSDRPSQEFKDRKSELFYIEEVLEP